MVFIIQCLTAFFMTIVFVRTPCAHCQDARQAACANEAEFQASRRGSVMLQKAYRQQGLLNMSEDNEDDASQPWENVDGGSGRACRGASADRAFEKYALYRSVDSLGRCKELCAKTPLCTGIAHDP